MPFGNPFDTTQLKEIHHQVSTPALIIPEWRLQQNIQIMQALADRNQVQLRPHIKTHKSVDFATLQLKHGATGITVAKLTEAEVMYAGGIKDIFITNQITQPLKIKRLFQLHQKCNLIIGIDHLKQIDLLRFQFESSIKPIQVRLEIDSGLNRCGVPVGLDLIHLAKQITQTPWLKLEGIFTHAGNVYLAKTKAEVRVIGLQEGSIMTKARQILDDENIHIQTVSIGSTPTVQYAARNPVVNEIRPGNYIFYDATQISLHAASADQCSLFVLGTVVSQPTPARIIIDAGSKALHTDGAFTLNGFGLPVNIEAQIERVSEEHGICVLQEPQQVNLGDPILIIPNHACVVANLFDHYYLIEKTMNITRIPISARGKSQ